MRVALLLILLGTCCTTLAQSLPRHSLPHSGGGLRGSGDYLARMDANRDGKVSLGEYQDWLSYAFDAMDRNRDGILSADELPGRRGQAITRAQHRERLAATFKKQDANRDGTLSAKELAAPPR